MKLKHTLLALTAVAGFVASTQAQVQLTLCGSTAFRSIELDRIPSLYDTNGTYKQFLDTAGKTTYSYSGTMSNLVPALGATPVLIRTFYSGSGSGMTAVKAGTLLPCVNVDGSATNIAADVAFSDVYPSAATPSIANSAFASNSIIGVVGFVFAKNSALTGITNITREQAVLLMTASGDGGMPASFLGGSSANPVYLIGRDSGSGTRITVEKNIGFVGSPNLWVTNGDGSTYSISTGLTSGGFVVNDVRGGTQSIGYLGLSDFLTVTDGSIAALNFQGIPYSHSAVASGMYPLWGYEHMAVKIGESGNQGAVIAALYKACTNPAYQSSPIYANSFVRIVDMHVSRGSDGGALSSKDF